MAQLVVRDLEEDVKIRLKRRAARHGRSMEDEVRDILRATRSRTRIREPRDWAQGSPGRGLDFDIPEIRGEPARPASFEE